jgi:hypothetical protein
MRKRSADVTIWGKPVQEIYFAAKSQANGILEFVGFAASKAYKDLNGMQT